MVNIFKQFSKTIRESNISLRISRFFSNVGCFIKGQKRFRDIFRLDNLELIDDELGSKCMIPIIDENNNYKNLDNIKELKNKTTVIYYDKNTDKIVAQPLKYFKKKPEQERKTIIEETNNVHIEGQRLGNSTDTRNYIDNFIDKENKKTFYILPAIKTFKRINPANTAIEKGKSIFNFLKKNITKNYRGSFTLSGNSITNYTMSTIAEELNKNKFDEENRVDIRLNQPAKGGFGPFKVDESNIELNGNIFKNLNNFIICNGNFDKENGIFDFENKIINFHKRSTYIDMTKNFSKEFYDENKFDEKEINENGAVTIFKLGGKVFDKPFNLKVKEGAATYKNAILNSTLEKQEINFENLPEELKSKIDFIENDSKNIIAKISKEANKDHIEFNVIDTRNNRGITCNYSLINNKIKVSKIDNFYIKTEKGEEAFTERGTVSEFKNNDYKHTISLGYNGKLDLMVLEKEGNKIKIDISMSAGDSFNFELDIEDSGKIILKENMKKSKIEYFIKMNELKSLLNASGDDIVIQDCKEDKKFLNDNILEDMDSSFNKMKIRFA